MQAAGNQNKPPKKKRSAAKKSARIVCHNKREFWTTQAQFWQWYRELKLTKLQDHPLTGAFVREDEESLIVISNNIFNREHRNHIAEALGTRQFMKNRRH